MHNLLDQHDVLTFHETCLSKPLTIFINEISVNKICEKSKDLENIFADPKYVSLDEYVYLYSPLLKGESILDIKRKIDCMFYLIYRENRDNVLTFYKEHLIKESFLRNDKIKFKNGKLISDNNELVHYHFMTEKQYFRFKLPKRNSLN